MDNSFEHCVHVVGGGTVDRVRQNLAVASVSYGETARRVADMCREAWSDVPGAGVALHLTRMACGGESRLETVDDVRSLLKGLVTADSTRAVFLPAELCSFQAAIVENSIPVGGSPESGTISPRAGQGLMVLTPREEVVNYVRAYRRELVLVGFATVAGLSEEALVEAAREYACMHMCSYVVAKDRTSRRWALASAEKAVSVSRDRDEVLRAAVGVARAAVRDVPSVPAPREQSEAAHGAHP